MLRRPIELTAAIGHVRELTAKTQLNRKASQNPVASLISVPVQNNNNFGIGPYDRTQNVLNIQPVIPIRASETWNLIMRWIALVIWQPAPGTANLEVFGIEENTPPYLAAQAVQKSAGVFGLGDITPTFFLSPTKSGKLIWGAGPVFVLPTATSRVLGQGKLSMGPSVVALIQPGKWTLGALVNNVWSVAGPSDRSDVKQMTLQYFVNYNLKKAWYLSFAPVLTANWRLPVEMYGQCRYAEEWAVSSVWDSNRSMSRHNFTEMLRTHRTR
jgi:hypothetical protein